MSRHSLAALFGGLLFLTAARAEPPFRYPEGWYGKAALRYRNGVPVLSVSGTPQEIGAAVGALALRPGARMARYPEDLLYHYHLHGLMPVLTQAARKMAAHFPADVQAEMNAMAARAGIGADQVALGNTLFDIKKFFACSALLVEPGRSTSGGPLLGRNLDYPSLGYAQDYSLVTVYRPAGRHAFASIGFPGMVGCLSGMNDAGLAVAVLEVFQVKAGAKRFDPTGLPYALCYRRVLEECTTIGEAQALLQKMRRVTITNLAVADRTGVAVFEVSPRAVRVRPAQQGACVCTNHYCTPELRPLAPLNVFHTLERFQTLERQTAGKGRLGPAELQRALHAVSMPASTMQTMVFEPATLRLHLSVGTCPSSAAPMKTLDLFSLFRAAPPGP